MADERFEEPLDALEQDLARLAPRKALVERDRLMYEAGLAAAGRSARPRGYAWLWPSSTAVLAAASAALLAVLVVRQPETLVRERVVYMPAPARSEPALVNSEPAEAEAQPDTTKGQVAEQPLETYLPERRRGRLEEFPRPPRSISPPPTAFGMRNYALAYGVESLEIPLGFAEGSQEPRASREELLEGLLDEQPPPPDRPVFPFKLPLVTGES